jgi:hypothetical protein
MVIDFNGHKLRSSALEVPVLPAERHPYCVTVIPPITNMRSPSKNERNDWKMRLKLHRGEPAFGMALKRVEGSFGMRSSKGVRERKALLPQSISV